MDRYYRFLIHNWVIGMCNYAIFSVTDPSSALEVLISDHNHMVLRLYDSGDIVYTMIFSRQDHILNHSVSIIVHY